MDRKLLSLASVRLCLSCFFFFNDTATTEIYTLSLHDALPISHFVVHLAAQAGVRNSIENPRSYTQSNLVGSFELLEAARAFPPAHLLMASTSSV